MATGSVTVVIGLISALGAVAQAAVTLRWYEPPERDGETPAPIFEAVLFFVGFGLIFAVLGLVVSALGAVAPPLGSVATLLLTPVGVGLAYAALTDRIGTMRTEAQQFLGVVFGIVVGVYPVVLLTV